MQVLLALWLFLNVIVLKTDKPDAEGSEGTGTETETFSETTAARQKVPEENDTFDYFAHSQSKDLDMFFSYHPQQPQKYPIAKVYNIKDGTNRKWLTYNEKTNSLYCSVCLAFAPVAGDSPFIKGGMNA